MQPVGALNGKVAIVTGAGQGLGKAYALRLAEEGAKVVVNDLGAGMSGEGADPSRAQAVVDQIIANGGEAIANGESVSSWASAEAVVASAVRDYGRLDILINNAGSQRPDLIWNVSEEDYDSLTDSHLKGTFAMVRHAVPFFMEQGAGVIINTGSSAGLGQYGSSVYASAKEGIAGFTRSIARDLGPKGIRANLIRPIAETPRSGTPRIRELALEAELEHQFPFSSDVFVTKMKRMAVPSSEAADFVVWLCTEDAAHLNGEDFTVRGKEISLMSAPQATRTIVGKDRWDLDALSHSEAGRELHGRLVNRFVGVRGRS